jgi:dienelactone hydrolase
MRSLAALAIPCLLAACPASADVETRTVEYKSGSLTCEGFRASARGAARQPGVLIVHQWTGISGHERAAAERLAKLGYTALVADVYGKGVRPQPPAAGAEAGRYKSNRALLRARLNDALAVLAGDPEVDPARLAVMGYCFGGTAALELARSGAPVRAAISFHGGLDSPSPADGARIRGKVLALHGDADPFVPAADVAAFEAEMRAHGVDHRLVRYPGVVHSFTHREAGTDTSRGAAYDAAADHDSWEQAVRLLAETLGPSGR